MVKGTINRRLVWAGLACGALTLAAAFAMLALRDKGPNSVPKVNVATLLPKKVAPTVVGWTVHMSTLAGDGHTGLREGPAQLARFADPFGIAVDPRGNVFVADAGDNNRIRRIGVDGVVETIAGGAEGFADGTGAAARFHTPSGLALDKVGNLYIADTGNNAIRKISAQGVVSTIAGGGAAGFRDGIGKDALFNSPVGVALDRAGNLLVTDTYNDRIRKIAPDGTVSTVAGGNVGMFDGIAAQARFDTPTGIAVDAQGAVLIADSGNGRVRKLATDGLVTTIVSAASQTGEVALRGPVSLAATLDGYVYVGDLQRGRIWQIAPDGALHGLTGVGIDFAIGDARAQRLSRPTGMALDREGRLYVADSVARRVRRLSPYREVEQRAAAPAVASTFASTVAAPAVKLVAAQPAPVVKSFPWPVAPQFAWHEVVGIVGECRGSYGGDSRHHFHSGLDVQAAMGVPVLAVAAEKVSNPTPNWAFGDVGEGISIDSMAYIHMRVGRDGRDVPLDPSRFNFVLNEKGQPTRVRVKRGTRFAVGDKLGTVNRMFHVHLAHKVAGGESNPIALPLPGLVDTIAPRIDSVFLTTLDGRRVGDKLDKRGKRAKPDERVRVAAGGGPLSLVVEAWDQLDGNAARRKLGLYKLGYQILRADGVALAGFEQPRFNIEFNRLPPDQESVKVAYAPDSGITVYGSASTRFLYVATNIVRDGRAETGSWDPVGMAPGEYVIRVTAADFAGNVALAGRDLLVTVE